MPATHASMDMQRLFHGLADPTRLRLLNLMADQEVCVCYFVEILALPQPTISRHLGFLRRAGVVSARRDGKWMHYSMAASANPFARALLKQTLRWLAADKNMQRERSRLGRACCSPAEFVKLQHAPSPVRLHRPRAERR